MELSEAEILIKIFIHSTNYGDDFIEILMYSYPLNCRLNEVKILSDFSYFKCLL